MVDLLRDGEFHSVHELESLLPGHEWIGTLGELLARNYAFDKTGFFLKMRMRGDSEPMQDLAELVTRWVGLIGDVEPVVTVTVVREEPPEDDFDPTLDAPAGEVGVAANTDDVVLSDPPESLTLSVADCLVMTAAILAKKNSGKTYLAMVLAEEFMKHPEVPLVVLDPTGVWFGIGAAANGQPGPYAVVILGGSRGHLPVTAKDGAKVAEVVEAIRPHPILVDMSELAPVEQHEFVADFIEKLFVAATRDPLHLIVDEADEFAPQVLSGQSDHQKRCLDAMDRLVRRGRSKGIGVTMITQRSAVLNKNVLSQTDSLWFLHMVDPRDLLALENRLRNMVTPEHLRECVAQVPRLHPGMAYFVQTGSSPKFRRFKVRRKVTFDSSKTPGMGGHVEPLLARPDAVVLARAKEILEAVVASSEEGEE